MNQCLSHYLVHFLCLTTYNWRYYNGKLYVTPSVQNHLKYLFMYKKITDDSTKNSEKSIIKKAIVQKLW